MIRIGAIIWLLVLALLGIGLFQVKYEVQAREVELRQVRKQVEASEASIRVLEAEWSYLNDLSRLSNLARRHTDLAPTTPSQVRDFAELPERMVDPQTGRHRSPQLLGENEPTPDPATPSLDDDVIAAILADMQQGASSEGTPPAAPTALPANGDQ